MRQRRPAPARPRSVAPRGREDAADPAPDAPRAGTPRPAARPAPGERATASPEQEPGERPGASSAARNVRLAGDGGLSRTTKTVIMGITLVFAGVVMFRTVTAYLYQRAQYDLVVSQVASAQATATALESELAQWQDDAYVKAQARERLSYVMPGETSYIVVGADSVTRPPGQGGVDPQETAVPWYEVLRQSAVVAGEVTPQKPAQPSEPARQGWTTQVPVVPTADPSSSPASSTPQPGTPAQDGPEPAAPDPQDGDRSDGGAGRAPATGAPQGQDDVP